MHNPSVRSLPRRPSRFVSIAFPWFGGRLLVSSWVRAGFCVGRLVRCGSEFRVLPTVCCPDDCNHLVWVNDSFCFWTNRGDWFLTEELQKPIAMGLSGHTHRMDLSDEYVSDEEEEV